MTQATNFDGLDLAGFLGRHDLSDDFTDIIERCYLPLAKRLEKEASNFCPFTIGIGGAQGTGKSTLADFLKLSLEYSGGYSVVALSLDDFYYTHAERHHLGAVVHPLLATRGVPGTHDLQMLFTCLERLRLLRPGETMALPRFDKAQDDRADPVTWPIVSGPIDVVVLEGWCLGAVAQPPEALAVAVNALERVADSAGVWRRYVNEQLAGGYASLVERIDYLVYLKAPDFDAVLRWRREQERKLAARDQEAMSDIEVGRFVQHFERLTRALLASPPPGTDVLVALDGAHRCAGIDWRFGTAE